MDGHVCQLFCTRKLTLYHSENDKSHCCWKPGKDSNLSCILCLHNSLPGICCQMFEWFTLNDLAVLVVVSRWLFQRRPTRTLDSGWRVIHRRSSPSPSYRTVSWFSVHCSSVSSDLLFYTPCSDKKIHLLSCIFSRITHRFVIIFRHHFYSQNSTGYETVE